MALIATEAAAVRTYASIEGQYDAAALAKSHGLKLWQGIWLGGDRAKNDVEIAKGIDIANKNPETVTRVIVGSEVLLRRDLPSTELIADIDRVKKAVHQPVAYADVWSFWEQFPEIALHVDVVLIHLLPYWENTPVGIDRAVQHVDETYKRMKRRFPGKQIAIGETGWPSRGRERADAVPSRINEARFLRAFLTLSQQEHFDYNFIEAFDQSWKYKDEGIVGASWGVFDAQRHIKIPLTGSISEDPDWLLHAISSIAIGLALSALGLAIHRPHSQREQDTICTAGMVLGAALGFGFAVALDTLYDIHLEIAAAANLTGQTALAILAMLRLAGKIPRAADRTAGDTSDAIKALLASLRPPPFASAFEDLLFLFLWTAAVMELLLVFDPRYREFPLATFAVPLVITVGRLLLRDAQNKADRQDILAAATLAIASVASAIQEGPLNTQSIIWNLAALMLAMPTLMHILPVRYKRRLFVQMQDIP